MHTIPKMDTSMQSLLMILIGKESHWFPLFVIVFLILQKWSTLQEYFQILTNHRKIQYTLSGKLYISKGMGMYHGNLPKQMYGILYDIHHSIQNKKLPIKNSVSLQLPDSGLDEKELIVPINGIWISPSLFVNITFQTSRSEISKPSYKSEYDEIEITICIQTSTSFNDIYDYISNALTSYNDKIRDKNILSISVCKPIDSDHISYISRIPFLSAKTFDNLFFDGKEELIQRLDTLKKGESYKRLGIAETLGILLYGEPGTGKTSTIKAIANYMKMNLIVVPMNKIKTRKQLDDLFYGSSISDIPYNKRIYVFEEIDCNGWDEIVKDRAIKEKTKDVSNTVHHPILIQSGDHVNIVKHERESNDKLTLGAILEIIDGLVEIPGRIIIMTTNHRDSLDPALLRPGRIDIEIEFKKLRREHIIQIYKYWYNMDIDTELAQKIPDYAFTQADISQLFMKYETNPQDCLSHLTC